MLLRLRRQVIQIFNLLAKSTSKTENDTQVAEKVQNGQNEFVKCITETIRLVTTVVMTGDE